MPAEALVNADRRFQATPTEATGSSSKAMPAVASDGHREVKVNSLKGQATRQKPGRIKMTMSVLTR